MPPQIKSFLDSSRSDKIGSVGQLQANVRSAYGVFNAIIGGVVFLVMGVFFFVFVQKLIGLAIVVIAVLIPVLTLRNRRKEMAYLNKINVVTSAPAGAALGETMVDYVAGVMAVGLGATTLATGGAGDMKRPENSIVVTSKNIWFVFVPLAGAGVITEHVDNAVAQYDFLLAKGDVDAKLKEIFAHGGLSELVNTDARNHSIALADLQSVESNVVGNIVFTAKSGERFSYAVRQAGDRDKILQLMAPYATVTKKSQVPLLIGLIVIVLAAVGGYVYLHRSPSLPETSQNVVGLEKVFVSNYYGMQFTLPAGFMVGSNDMGQNDASQAAGFYFSHESDSQGAYPHLSVAAWPLPPGQTLDAYVRSVYELNKSRNQAGSLLQQATYDGVAGYMFDVQNGYTDEHESSLVDRGGAKVIFIQHGDKVIKLFQSGSDDGLSTIIASLKFK